MLRRAQRVSFDGMVQERTEQIQAWLKRFDVVIIGPGLGRDEMTMKTVINVHQPLLSHSECADLRAMLSKKNAHALHMQLQMT